MRALDPLAELHKFCEQFETKGDAASALSVSKQYLSDMIHARRDISPRLLKKLGLQRIVVKEQKTA